MALILSLLLVVGGLTACGPKETDGGKVAGEITDWVTYQTIASEMETFNFQYSQNAKELDVLNNCFDGLTTNDPYGNLIPCIAERWETPDGGKTWTFYLRKGVPWVDYQGNKKGEVVAEDSGAWSGS